MRVETLTDRWKERVSSIYCLVLVEDTHTMKMKALLFTEWRAARRPGDEPIKRINSEAGALPFCHPGLSSRVPPPFALRCFALRCVALALLCFALVSLLPSLAQSRLLLVLSRASQLVSLSSFVTAVLSSPFPISSTPPNLAIIYLYLACFLRILSARGSPVSRGIWRENLSSASNGFPRSLAKERKEEIDRSLDCRQPNTINPSCSRALSLSLSLTLTLLSLTPSPSYTSPSLPLPSLPSFLFPLLRDFDRFFYTPLTPHQVQKK